MLNPYIKNQDIYKCPSNDARMHGNPADSSKAGATVESPYYKAGYAMWLPDFSVAGLFPNGTNYPQTLAGLNYPAQELIILEDHYIWPDTGPYLSYCEPSPCPPGGDTSQLPGTSTWSSGHAKKAGNIIYMDGHAKWRRYRDTFMDDPGRNGENDWRYSYNWAKNNGYGWMNTLPDQMDSYKNDSGSYGSPAGQESHFPAGHIFDRV